MRKIENFSSVQESTGSFNKPTAGAYICEIVIAEDVPLNSNTGKGDYLKISYDILEGDFKGFYSDLSDKFGYNFPNFIRSYKNKALGMFKHFTNCVEEDNEGYTWNWDEHSLKGLKIGLIIGEEEYVNKNGDKKTRNYVADIKRISEIKNGDYKVPELKKLKVADEPKAQDDELLTLAEDEQLPF